MDPKVVVQAACRRFGNDPRRMLDILWEIQDALGCVDGEAMGLVAEQTGTYRVEVEGIVTFYAFFTTQPQGKFIIRLCEDIIDRHAGMAAVRTAFEEALGINVGETSADGLFSLHLTPCIGLCDQAPGALVNEVPFTRLTPEKARGMVETLRTTHSASDLIETPGEGNNGHPLVRAMVDNNIRLPGEALLGATPAEAGLTKARRMSPRAILEAVTDAGLRSRGGAGFMTGAKWRLAAGTGAEARYIICNADEGEPGTFKDRVPLTEKPDLLFEGMGIAARAIGARQGILYLRAEYRYLRPYLLDVLERRRRRGLLGGDFDIRIQLGAGAYICGEESALISSCEGRRGEPKNRPPFPVQSGYLDFPTVVNNVETLCNVPSIIDRGAPWFASLGTREFEEFRRFGGGKPVNQTLAYHWARMIEVLHCVEKIKELLLDPDPQGRDLVLEGERREEGIAVIEAPRGSLFHQYRVDEHDQVTYCNLIVSTTHNNTAMNRAVTAVAKKYLSGRKRITEAMLNTVEVAIRAFDPCLSCATHALGQMPLAVELYDAGGELIERRETHYD